MKASSWLLFIFVCFLSCFSVAGCAFRDLEKELVELEELYALRGKIVREQPEDRNILVVLYERTSDGDRLGRAILVNPESDAYVADVKAGTYYVVAFSDRNENLAYDRGEPIGYYGIPTPIAIPEAIGDFRRSKVLELPGIVVSATKRLPADYNVGILLKPELVGKSMVKLGEPIGFEDEIMNGEYGVKGYWKPLTFLREIGTGVFFLHEYDPKKIPVLFVHGAVGTPLGWKETVDWINTDRYQPWFYYYPSGLPLEKSSDALNKMIDELHRRHGFREMAVVAQSMGGLVARSFILKSHYESNHDFVTLFISVSTPWNGHVMTEKGVRQAPAAVPSWYDMVPESDFIQSVFRRKLPKKTKYYLFFSFKGDCSLFLANNDGTVELSSQLDYRAQAEADKIFALNEDHGGIVFSNQYLRYMHELLDE